eukprot:gnl/MRDRNA2_/MRDRNA2_103086_c0_seq1.p1 gnl/MRDRNA2_/MRDRNA2_103086_c0~~gnl/MRDRNA2_/MRDRNA2_103086_c0_seq1.p1  ORF type:complete len:1000 (+),score=198.51 gnl/MRDRNA2_/MRDRNA2_103086_c0_seq1:91-3090(+)
MGHPVIVELRPAGRPPRPHSVGTRCKLYGDILSRPLSCAPIPGSPISRKVRSPPRGAVQAKEKKQVRSLSRLRLPASKGCDESPLPSAKGAQSATSNASSSPPPEPDFMFSPSRRLDDIQQTINLTPEQNAVMREELKDWYFFPMASAESSSQSGENEVHAKEVHLKAAAPEFSGALPAVAGCHVEQAEQSEPADGRKQTRAPVSQMESQKHRSKIYNSELNATHSVHQKVLEKTSRPSSREKKRHQTSVPPQQSLKERKSPLDYNRWLGTFGEQRSPDVEALIVRCKKRVLENPEFMETLQGALEMPDNVISALNQYMSELKKKHEVCRKEDLEKVEEVIKSLCKGKVYMDMKDFEHFHDIVQSIIAPKGHVTIGRLGPVFSWKADLDFRRADLRRSGRLQVSDILLWLHKLYVAAQEDFEPWMNRDFSDVLQDVVVRCKAKHEVHKYEQTSSLLLTMQQYGRAYRDLRKTTQGSIIIENEGEAEPLQPPSIKCFDDLHLKGKEHFDLVQELGEEVKKTIGAQFWGMGPLKDLKRGKEKIECDYNGNPRRLLDVVRFSVICADLNMARHAIETVRKHHHWEIVRVKSAFASDANVGQTGGYRDIKVNARHKGSGLIIEIQMHILVFYMIKQEGGHKLYEWSRNFNIGGITSAEDVLGEVSLDLLSNMMEIAEIELEHAIQQNAIRKEVKKRMTLFECARLARVADTINEQGWKLLEYIGESKAGSSYPPEKCKVIDQMEKRDIMLKVAKAPKFNISRNHRQELLQKAMQTVEEDEKAGKWISTNDKLFLAECKCAMALSTWGMDEWDIVIPNLEETIDLYAKPSGCGLGYKHPAVARAMMYLGSAFVACGKVQAGIEHLRTAEASMVHWYGELDYRTSDVFLEMSAALKSEFLQMQHSPAHRVEAYQKSVSYLERCLLACKSCFGQADMRVGNVYLHLADIKETRGDREGAIADFSKCVEIWEISGKLHMTYLHTEDEKQKYGRLLSVTKMESKNAGT